MRLNRKIEAGKLAMKFNHGSVVGAGGFFGCFIGSYMRHLAVYLNSGSKAWACWVNSEKTALAWHSLMPIHLVLRISAKSKILFTIIKRVAVYVVYKNPFRSINYSPVHSFVSALAVFPYAVLYSANIAFMLYRCLPFALRQPFKIFIIDKCDITFCKLNFFHNPKTNAGQNVSPVISRSWSERPTLTPCSALLKISSEYAG